MSEFLDSPDYFIAVFCILLLKYFFFLDCQSVISLGKNLERWTCPLPHLPDLCLPLLQQGFSLIIQMFNIVGQFVYKSIMDTQGAMSAHWNANYTCTQSYLICWIKHL